MTEDDDGAGAPPVDPSGPDADPVDGGRGPDEATIRRLQRLATDALENATPVESGYCVAAAAATTDGKDRVGANQEDGRISETIHGEEAALLDTLADGERFETIVILTGADDMAAPCGRCRQTLVEAAADDAHVVSAERADGAAEVYELDALVPNPFGEEIEGESYTEGLSAPDVDGPDADLFDAALDARAGAPPGYSGRGAVAAVEMDDGSVYAGADVEFANFTNSRPAEQVALTRALVDGHGGVGPDGDPEAEVESLAVVAADRAAATPGGATLEFVETYGTPDTRVLAAAPDGEGVDETTLGEALPGRAGGESEERARGGGEPRGP